MLEDCLHLAGRLTSSGMKIGASSSRGQRLDEFLRLVVQIGDGELGAEGTKGLGAAPGDRLVVGDPDDQPLLPSSSLAFATGMAVVEFREVFILLLTCCVTVASAIAWFDWKKTNRLLRAAHSLT